MSSATSTLGITALWTTLVATLGLALVVRDVGALRVSVRSEPEALTCDEWARSKRLRWVRVQGCVATGVDAGSLQQVSSDGGIAWVEGPLGPTLEGTSRTRPTSAHPEPVLTVGEDPRQAKVLVTALLGLVVMAWGMLPWVRRWQAAAAEKRASDQVFGRHGR